jgi:hypothetical protein
MKFRRHTNNKGNRKIKNGRRFYYVHREEILAKKRAEYQASEKYKQNQAAKEERARERAAAKEASKAEREERRKQKAQALIAPSGLEKNASNLPI